MSLDKKVNRILISAGQLKQLIDDNQPVAVREVTALREAFNRLHENLEPYEFSKKSVQCDTLLKQLTQKTKDDANASTGDLTALDEKWKFANIPKRRRLQTFTVSIFLFFTMLPACLGLFALLCMNWFTFPFVILYLVYMFTWSRPRHPLKKQKWYIRSGFWKHYRDYFPIRLVVDKPIRQKFNPKKNYFFVYHPHGVHGFGAMINFAADANGCSEMLPGITVHVQTLKLNFWIPFWREFFTLGGSGDASASCIRSTLSAGPGESIMLVVGGAEESLLSSPNTNNLTLLKRKGFVKLALTCGSPLVPVYAFGENNVYDTWATGKPGVQRFLLKLQKKLGFAMPLIKGRGYFNYHFGILPHRRPIVCVVGAPIDLPKIAKPTQEEIDKWHGVYVEALKELYNENKDVYDLSATGLRLVA